MQLRCFIPHHKTAWFPVGILAFAGSLSPRAAQAAAPDLEIADALPIAEANEPLTFEPQPSPAIAENTVEISAVETPQFSPPPPSALPEDSDPEAIAIPPNDPIKIPLLLEPLPPPVALSPTVAATATEPSNLSIPKPPPPSITSDTQPETIQPQIIQPEIIQPETTSADATSTGSAIAQIPTERDLLPPQDSLPTPQPIEPDLPLDLPAATPQPDVSAAEQTFLVERFEITGDPQVFSPDHLLNAVQAPTSNAPLQTQPEVNLSVMGSPDGSNINSTAKEPVVPAPLAEATPRAFSVSELLQVATNVANFYQAEGYSTSGAIIDIPKATEENGAGVVNIKVIEGQLETVQVEKTDFRANFSNSVSSADDPLTTGLAEINIPTITRNRLNRYVQARLKADPDQPLNVNKLQESLQLLQLDPLIDNISAELSEGAEPGSSQLRVQYDPARRFSAQSRWDNSRSPSIGAGQRKISLAYHNLLGVGDRLSFGYGDTKGSGSLDASYSLPINARNGSLSFAYSRSGSSVIEAPFDDIDGDGETGDIESRSSSYELTLRQPIIRRIHDRETFEELGLGLTGSFRESQSKLLGEPFPLSPAADREGRTKITALRFFQDYTRQNARQVISLRSQVNLGLGLLGATVHDSDLGGVELPDSQFLSWQGQAQWLRVLGQDSVFLAQGNAQLAANLLPSAEQFSIGGAGTVRGYRQDVLQTDNGVFASAEVQLPIARLPKLRTVVQAAPFVDVGKVWSAKNGESPDPNTLASVGLGLQAKVGNRFTARIDYGVPLISIGGEKRTLQEKGFLFSLGYSL